MATSRKNEWRAPGPVSNRYFRSTSGIRIIQGPIESAKSTTSAMCLYAAMCTMPRWRDGKRRSRWLVTRTTYPELRGSTVETFLYWFPPEIYAAPGGGKFYDTEPYYYEMRFRDVVADVIFEAFPDDKDETIRSLRSKEYTGAWINECQYTPQRLFFEIATRTGRYPPKKELPEGMTLGQWVVADLNAPPVDDHWILRMRGDVPLPLDMPPEERRKYEKPPNVEFFKQPPALIEEFESDGKTVAGYRVNPVAENIQNMDKGRYIELTGGKSKAEIDRDLMGRVVPVKRGEPVFPQARRALHVAEKPMAPMPGAPVVLGMDFGRTPAVVFGQSINGRWVILDEMVAFNMGAITFAPMVRQRLQERFPDSPYSAWGDPSGDWRGQADEKTPFQIFRAAGIEVRAPAAKDAPQKRIEATEAVMTTLIDGRPRLLIDPGCKHLIAAVIDGGYVFTTKTDLDGVRLIKEPMKNAHSHVAEALQYLLWGAGEVREVLRPQSASRKSITTATPRKRNLFAFTSKGRGRR